MANKISKSTAYIIDLLCEGEIEGPANGTWPKSTYFNETVVQNNDGTYNFDGTTIIGRTGTATDANYLNDFNTGDMLQAETIVNVEMTYVGGATARSITDDEVDHCAITFAFPQGLVVAYDSGKQYGLNVGIRITITPTNGVETTLIEDTISKYARSEFRQQYVIKNISSYFRGADTFPVVIKCYRTTNDRVSSSKATYIDQIKWYSYTEMKEVKLGYRNRAVVATELLAEDFGDNIPNRAWKIKGLKIKVPNNYTVATRTYNGIWDGGFAAKQYCNNPAWVVYDLLTNKRYGLGIDEDKVDKWTLYSIGQYCDGNVTYHVNIRQPDGSYIQSEVIQPRYTFNGVISDREQALVVINHFCGVFRGFPMWGNGLVTFGQDAPASMTRIATNANVKDGIFEYEGTGKRQRTTAVKVGWNDPDNFGKQDTIVLEDRDGIVAYGYNPFDFYAIGCTNRNEAILRGKYALYTNINQTEIVKFSGGLEWADALPGDIIGIQDANYTSAVWSGRIVNSTTTSITIDQPVTIVDGTTYTLYYQTPTSTTTSVTLTNSPGTTTTLTWATPTTAPTIGLVWAVSSTTLAIRKFRIMSVREEEKMEYQIVAYEYDPNKYALVENNLYIESPIPTTMPVGVLSPPSNFTAEPYSYLDGDNPSRKYGVRLSWTPSTDVRTQYYEIHYAFQDGQKMQLDETADNAYDFKDINAGVYDFYLRAKSLTSSSKWLVAADITVATAVSGILPPANLRVYGGGTTWAGKDCHIVWDATDVAYYNGTTTTGVVSYYKIEVRKADTTLLRSYTTASKFETDYIYTYEMNMEDNNGLPVRNLLFYAYSVDIYGITSDTYTTLSCANPAPDMSSSMPVVTPRQGYLEIDWAQVSDADMAKYVVYVDTTNPPASGVGEVAYPVHRFEYFNVEYGNNYYVKIYPYDLFGIGIGSQIPSGASPLLIPGLNVDVELAASITMTTDASYTGTLSGIYDKNFVAGGITIANPSGKYIQYAYNIEDYFDRLAIWSANANPRVYIATSTDGINWTYFKALATHALDTDKELDIATNQTDAVTNYWQLVAGFNHALFPNKISAKYVRMYFTNTNTTQIYEFIPSRILISELAAIESLSSISANIGNITTGVIQSNNYGSSTGFKIDMNDSKIYLGGNTAPVLQFYNDGTNKLDITAAVTFRSGTSGYAQITDRPADSTILNSYNQNNGNIVTFPDFEGTTNYTNNIIGGWNFGYTSTKPISGGLNYAAEWRAINTNTVWWQEGGPIGGSEESNYSYIYTNPISVEPNKRYCFSVYTGAHRCNVVAYVACFDNNNNWIQTGSLTYNNAAQSGGTQLGGYYKHISFVNAPSNTKYVRCYIVKYQTKVGQTSSFIFAARPMLSEVGINQTTAPAWSAGGTDNRHWAHPSDVTKIDGGDIYVGSQLNLNEGGKAVFGNQNVIIDTAGNHGSIIVAPDGGPTGQHYCQLNNADILFLYWNGSSHQLYNSMVRIEAGTATANTNVTLPGIWKEPPKIIVSPNTLSCYNASYSNQNQTIKVYHTGPYPTGNTYYFGAYAELQLAAGTVGAAGAGSTGSSSGDFYTAQINLVPNTRRIIVNCTCYGYKWTASQAVFSGYGEYARFEYYRSAYYYANYQVLLYYYLSGVGWTHVSSWQYSSSTRAGGYAQTKSFTFDTGTQSYDITAYKIRMYVTGYDNRVTDWINTGSDYISGGYYFNCNDQGYTSNLVSATALAYGTLNWLAIGR